MAGEYMTEIKEIKKNIYNCPIKIKNELPY